MIQARTLPFHVPCEGALFLLCVILPSSAQLHAQTRASATVVVDASAFLDEIPKGVILTNAQRLRVPWIFNDTALVLDSRSNLEAQIRIPEPGTYHVFARSQGEGRSSFKVAVNGRATTVVFGNGPLAWTSGGTFELEEGPARVRLTRIEPAPVVDVVVLTKDPKMTENELRPLQYGRDVKLLARYEIPRASAVKFGDVDADGKADFIVLTRDYSAHLFDHAGALLWQYDAPAEGARLRGGFEAPGVVWDLDQDGFGEVVHWRWLEGQERLVVADGKTGRIRNQVAWPTPPLPHVYNNFRIAVGKLRPGYPANIVVFTDSGGRISITAYTADLRQLWQHTEVKAKDHLGHYVYPVDLTGDGIDEVVVSALVLDANGRKLWDRFDQFHDNHDHADSFRFGDIDGDGQVELLIPNSEYGVVVMRASTGEVLWQRLAEHTQQLEFGNFLEGVPAPQIAVTARTYGIRGEPRLSAQVWWFNRDGDLLSKWPGKPINGNPDFVKGDWLGDGRHALFWHKFRLMSDGRGELYFGEPVYHMFDFMGNGADEVVTVQRTVLKVYGSKLAHHDPVRVKRSADYLRHHMTNHTHY